MNNEASVLIVGSMAFDDLELPSCNAKNVVGGSATYAAFAASAFAPSRIVAVVGEDFPEATLRELEGRGVDTAGVEKVAGRTFRWAGRYDADLAGRTTLDTQLNVFADFRPRLPQSYRDSGIVMLGNIHPALQLEVLDQVTQPRLVLADTMNYWIQGEPSTLATLLKRIDILVVNDEEARELSGHHNIRRAAREILQRGPKRLIIKRGEHGALLFDEQGIFAAPGFPLEEVLDPTGAGDSFAGGFVGFLARQPTLDAKALRRAMMHATATASYCVEAVGTARIASLSKQDVATRVGAIQALYDYGAQDL